MNDKRWRDFTHVAVGGVIGAIIMGAWGFDNQIYLLVGFVGGALVVTLWRHP